jgi:hypothetical protein
VKDTKGFKLTATKCLHCGKSFRCYRVTKPPGFCSGGCQYLRERQLQNERRQRAREKMSRSGTLNENVLALGLNLSTLTGCGG